MEISPQGINTVAQGKVKWV